MILLKLFDIIISAGVILGFFLAAILISSKNVNKKSNLFLSLLLIILSLSIAHSIFMSDTITSPYKIKQPFILLIGPMLLFYVRAITSGNKFTFFDTIHFTPFIFFIVVVAPVWVHGVKTEYGDILFSNSLAMGIGVWGLTIIQYGYYWWKSVRLINSNRTVVELEYSNTEGKTLSWVKNFMHIFGIFFFLLVATLLFAVHSEDYVTLDKIVCLALAATIFVLGYAGLFQKEIFSNISESPADIKKKEERLLKSPVDNELLQKLLNYVDEKKPFLNDDITLTALAKQLDMTRNQLSFLINSMGSNFYTFINKYRVEEFKRLISDPGNKNYTILSLAYEAGFPSKSSFQTIFKKTTGLTPTEYFNKIQ